MAQATAPILDSTDTDQSARSDDVRSSGDSVAKVVLQKVLEIRRAAGAFFV
jgi:hypothetical protein